MCHDSFRDCFFPVFWSGKSDNALRTERVETNQKTLNILYKYAPKVRKIIQGAYGYVTFANIGVNLILFSTEGGKDGGALNAAITVEPGVRIYKLTKNSLALQATIQGTKYWRDQDLN